MITTAWILIAVGLFCSCLVLPPFAIVQANKAKAMGNPAAKAPLIVAWILTAIYGLILIVYAILFATMGMAGMGF